MNKINFNLIFRISQNYPFNKIIVDIVVIGRRRAVSKKIRQQVRDNRAYFR